MRRALVINGPNLNLLGKRRPDVYGSTNFDRLEELCHQWGGELGFEVQTIQSNHEGAIVDALQQCDADGVVLNAGALTHYSLAIRDAIEAIEPPVVEIHISNIHEREPFRRVSVIQEVCAYTIYGRGVDGYRWALRHLANRIEWPFSTLEYGPHPDQVADLRLPEGGRSDTVVVMLHGGHWRHEWTRDTMESIAVDLARRGIANLNLEYRRVGMGGNVSTMLDDIKRAVDILIRQLGADKWALLGHSAGGHLALLAAPQVQPRPVLVVAMAAVADMEATIRFNPAVKDLAQAMAAGHTLADVSPVNGPSPGVPILLVHGDFDKQIPISNLAGYRERLEASREPVEVLTGPGEGHDAPIDPESSLWSRVARTLVRRLA